MPGGNIRVMVTTADACQQLECQPVTILGEKYFFRELDTLETKYYLDVFGVGVEEEPNNILRALHKVGCQVAYDSFRETKVGKVIEQIVYDKHLYPVRGKNALILTERPRFGQRGPYCLDLGAALASGTRQHPNENKKNNNNKKPNTTHTQPQNQKQAKPQQAKQKQTTAPTAVAVVPKKVEMPVQIQELATRRPERKNFDQISLELNSPPSFSSPGSPDFSQLTLPILQLKSQSSSHPRVEKDGDTYMQLAWTRGKRNRTEPFDQMVSNAPPRALPTLARSNYFAVLATMEVEVEDVQAVANP
ncbi:unnamed protein product [Albugo candida]|uniref:Uncharacterized protein n=1 Tax=Albugo candida TaxID=65357 RepID=A0A024FYG0_9STRA|nr:unnamed protein product [Albugo candida]|eukprot:CCI11709.1 unnamed protein product [Albugo candida]